ncbi:MAG TPA: NUDIX hydrolase [Intrasporangium sp.]|uniref:NUDIX hydrolase n=1 Tax=Intrasporangium sp. TaxID=1925024 RepID=UPI002D76CB99|nr:NUDIX hydrolase [Intrasporangium sp.]HET7398000.1 NUDIX hydrolase [Intrasporangium sp.]
MSWPTRESRVAYENPWIVVREDAVTRPDGSPGLYGVVELRQPAVFVVALSDADEVVLVTVDRHTVGPSIELPSGGTDGEDPLAAAQRELVEETGLVARTWRHVGTMQALNGICRAPEHVFLATGLAAAADHDVATPAEEGIRQVRRLPVADVLGLVRDGSITDGETIAALLHALLALGRVG